MNNNSLLKKAIAECLGTFVLVFFACGTAIVTGAGQGDIAADAATALAFGLVIVSMAHCIGSISGCHINPAVSIAQLFNKKINLKEFGCYVLAQFVGATVGAAALFGILNCAGFDLGATNAVVNTDFSGYLVSILIEIVLTFVFVYTILCVTSKSENSKKAGFVIGLTLTLVHLLGIELTGTSVNPARSFGPALMLVLFGGESAALVQVWVFIVAPLLGGLLAACVFKYFNREAPEIAPE